MTLLAIEEARARMLAPVTTLPAELVALDDALGRVLAQDLVAHRDQPPFDASAMDGWAVRAADGLAPRRIVGESAAGHAFLGTIGPGEAVRVFTGAPLPRGADHVIVQEEATHEASMLVFADLGKANVRPRGLDHRAGQTVLTVGQRLDGPRLAIAASLGQDPVAVIRRPRVALIATGDELVAPGRTATPDQIYDSVSFGLAGLISGWGGLPMRRPRQGDAPDRIGAAVALAREVADLVVLIGGASVGDYDFARAAVDQAATILVEKVAVRPGKPTWFAHGPSGPLLGLPGNPASALVAARLFLRPLLEAMSGLAPAERAQPFSVRLGHPLPVNGPRAHVRRARITTDANAILNARADFDPDSSLLAPFAVCNALIVQDANSTALEAGTRVAALWLE